MLRRAYDFRFPLLAQYIVKDRDLEHANVVSVLFVEGRCWDDEHGWHPIDALEAL